ncbi:MAG: transcriptional repressor [Opitutaceae bacterium]|nr:transcriptional repressor [Opitutaceae bacterium]
MIDTPETNTVLASDSSAAGTPIEVAVARLRAAGLRITQPRIAILNALIRREQPASIEQIHNDLKGNTFCDLVTVYRCLAAFEELDLVRRCFFHNGTSLWQINLAGETTYHVVCKVTNSMEQLDPQTTADLNSAIKRVEDVLKSRGYSDIGHMVEFFAVSPGAKVEGAGKLAVDAGM